MESLRTENWKLSARNPWAMPVYSVPSHVLQSQPLRLIFCTNPARCALEYVQLSAADTHTVKTTIGSAIKVSKRSLPQCRRLNDARDGGASLNAVPDADSAGSFSSGIFGSSMCEKLGRSRWVR